MVDEEMIVGTSLMLGDARLDEFIPFYLEVARGAVINHLFPYRVNARWEDVPEKHHSRVCEIAVYLISRRGGEGETSHSESGVSRSYESAGIPKSYFDGMVPFVGVPKVEHVPTPLPDDIYVEDVEDVPCVA